MKPYLQAKLSCDDNTLFTHCACHVFADELLAGLILKGFVFGRLADLNRRTPQMQALHVFLSKDSTLVDFDGIQNLDEFLEASRKYRLARGGPIPRFEILACSRDELFEEIPRADDREFGARNKWELLIDAEFVAQCRRRAQVRLSATSERYHLC